MIVSESYFRFEAIGGVVHRRELAQRVFPVAELAALEFFGAAGVPRIAEVVVEEGSTKLRTRIRTSAIALLVGYGGLRAGVDYIWRDGKKAAEWMAQYVEPLLPPHDQSPVIRRRRAPAGTRFRRLFDSVEAGDLSIEEATARAEAILQEYGETRDTIGQLTEAFRDEFSLIQPRQREKRDHRPPSPPSRLEPTAKPSKRLSVFRDPKSGAIVFHEI